MIKKTLALIFALLAVVFALSSCVTVEEEQTTSAAGNDAVDYDFSSLSIVDEYQQTQKMCSDLKNRNHAQYKGKTVRMKGEYLTSNDGYHFLVIFLDDTRCCYNDFEIVYSGSYPAAGTQVEVTGTIGEYTASDGVWPCIRVESMKPI